MLRRCIGMLVLLVLAGAAPGYAEDAELAKIFQEKHVNGTMVLSCLNGQKTYIYNEARARTRFSPASTFKIPNTLIALEEGVLANEKQIFQWDGKDRGLPAWNQDQSLETAFPSSCVWFYQELAQRVGKDTYLQYLKILQYGNERTGAAATTFWLNGELTISALEQVDFLKKLYRREYPFQSTSYDILKKIMLVAQTTSYRLWGKTGWAVKATPQIGWFVGFVESGDKVWFFATNINIIKPEDLRLRQEVTLAALQAKGIIQ